MKEFNFLLAVWKANLQSVMEYRVAFLLQVFGMMINNAIYFLIWVIYFDRFKEVRGWGLNDMFVTYQSRRCDRQRPPGLLPVHA